MDHPHWLSGGKESTGDKGRACVSPSCGPNGRGDLAGNEKGALQPALEQLCDRLPAPDTEDRRQTFFSKMHRRYGEYDYFEFHYDVENIRIAKSEQRDLLQDLRDVADGLEVVHAVDLKKEQAAKKRESRQRRREQKERRLNKRRSPAPPKEEQLTLLTEEDCFSDGSQTD